MTLSIVLFVCLVTTTFAQTDCGADSYTGPFGVISSPSNNGTYDNLINCDYNVYGSADSSLTFIFSAFHVENGDVVTISCPTNTSFPPQTYSGHNLPDPVSIPWCSHGLVNFQTDDSLVSTGFSLDYFVNGGGCGQTLYTGLNENVTSPNWPSNYGNDEDCLNIIWLQQQNTTHLHFRNFDLERCSSCDCDWLEIRCIDNSEGDPERYCRDDDNYMTYIYRCSQVLLWFHSDAANNFPGFNIEYNIYEDGGCGATSYYGPSGVISSPNHPGNYNSNQECNYDIYASDGSSLLFVFKSMNVEVNFDYVTISCPSDPTFPPQRFSGMFLPSPFSVPGCSHGRVSFFADYGIEGKGFTLDYHVSVEGDYN
jgi:cubilin